MSSYREPQWASIEGLKSASLAVLYIGAQWARVNASTRQFIIDYASKTANSKFVILDEKDCGNLCHHYSINTFPSTVVLKEGGIVDQIHGGNQANLSRMLDKHCNVAEKQSSHSQIAAKQHTLEVEEKNSDSEAAKLAECLAAVKKVNAEEQQKVMKTALVARSSPVGAVHSSNEILPLNNEMHGKCKTSTEKKKNNKEKLVANLQTHDVATSSASVPDNVKCPLDSVNENKQKLKSQTSDDVVDSALESNDSKLMVDLLAFEIPRDKAARAIRHSGATTAAEVIEWIVLHDNGGGGHDDDKDNDNVDGKDTASNSVVGNTSNSGRIQLKPGSGIKGYKCTDSGVVFQSMTDAQLYAERTGFTNFEECEIEIRQRTLEEKKIAQQALLQRVKQKREKRAIEEKEHERMAELERRQQGILAAKQNEEFKALARKQEVRRIKRMKAEQAAAKKKQLEMWEMDHKERVSGTADAARTHGPRKLTVYEAEAKTKKGIASLKTYTNGVGLKCLKLLAIYIANAKKEDPKFHRINLGNTVFLKRVKPCVGYGSILIAAGFKKHVASAEDSSQGYWHLNEQNEKKLDAVLALLERAKRSPGFK